MESEKESEKGKPKESQEEEEEKGKPKESQEEEEETALLLKTTKVVEYLEPLMSSEFLCKFPDNSAYDFDYSQSTIWSPLVPRPYSTTTTTTTTIDFHLITPTKLSYDLGARSTVNKLWKKLTSTAFKKKHHKNKLIASYFSSTPPKFKGACNPNKRWGRVLKAASKQFKKWKVKRDPVAHPVMLPKSFKDEMKGV